MASVTEDCARAVGASFGDTDTTNNNAGRNQGETTTTTPNTTNAAKIGVTKGLVSGRLVCYDYGFAAPAGATIDGIEVSALLRASHANYEENEVRLVHGDFDYLGAGQSALLCMFDGTDGDTSDTDYSTNSLTLAFQGNAELDDAQKVYGATSLLLDGTSGTGVEAEYNADLIFTEDFCIEGDVRFASTSGSQQIIGIWNASEDDRSWRLWLDSGTLKFDYSTNGTTVTTALSYSWSPSANTWYHVAVAYDHNNDDLALFVDGSRVDSDLNISLSFHIPSNADIGMGFRMDGAAQTTYADELDGWIDNLRVFFGDSPHVTRYDPTVATVPDYMQHVAGATTWPGDPETESADNKAVTGDDLSTNPSEIRTWGGPTDTWGMTGIDVDMVNDPTFGCFLIFEDTGSNNGAIWALYVDMTVYYTPVGGSGVPAQMTRRLRNMGR